MQTGPASSAPASSAPPASASPAVSLRTPAATGPLTIYADITIRGAFGSSQDDPVVAEAPNGVVFAAGAMGAKGAQVIWAVEGSGKAGPAEHVTGPVTALAVDAASLYVGIGQTIDAYSRTTGNLVQHWTSPTMPGSVSQLVLAGDRLWGLFTEPGDTDPGPNGVAAGLVEIDPSASTVARTIGGITGTFSIAANATGVYYVTKQSSELVEQTNDGQTFTAPTKQQVDLELSGPSAIQAVAVSGNAVVVQHDAGQGLDAELDSYNATTLAGPADQTEFSAAEQLITTPTGTFVVGNPDTSVCAADQQQCFARFAAPGASASTAVALPAATLASAATGPYPTVVVGEGTDLHVLRIG